MVTLIHKRRDNRAVRDVALRATEGCPPQDDRCRMNKIQEWARATLRYERDPRGGELIHDPVDTLGRIGSTGVAAGDCDDGAVLVSTMLESLGIRTRLTAVSLRRDRRLHHVAVEARDQAGRWWYVDPFLSRAAALPTFTRLMRVSV